MLNLSVQIQKREREDKNDWSWKTSVSKAALIYTKTTKEKLSTNTKMYNIKMYIRLHSYIYL